MSLEPGGYSEKLGNRFEGKWVVRQLLRLAFEDIRSVTIECIGDDERGVDLWIERNDGSRQAQQCKARNASREHWSVSDLRNRGILSYLKLQLDRNEKYEFALVTAIPATQIADICQSARDSNGQPEDFYLHQIQAVGHTRRATFRDFCQSLELSVESPNDREHTFDYLRRTHIHSFFDDQNTRDELRAWAGMLFSGNPDVAIASLADFADHELRKPIYTDTVLQHMTSLGFSPKQLAYDNRIAPAIEERQHEFVDWLQPKLIRHDLIPRDETQRLRASLEHDCIAVVHGSAGTGKSGVLLELVKELTSTGIVCLPISLDQLHPENTTREFGAALGLPDSPALCLDAAAGTRPSVLIIDQLDALRWTAAHSHNALAVCRTLAREVQTLRLRGRQISLVFSCRTFDLEHDPELRNWLGNESQGPCRKIEVKVLADTTVENIVGQSYSALSTKQRNVLASPHNLAMWLQLDTSNSTALFQSGTSLMRLFWDDRRRSLRAAGIADADSATVLETLVNYMDQQRTRTAPESLLRYYPQVVEALHSLGVLYTAAHRVAFAHQSYVDFLIADRQLRRIYEGATVQEWLGQRSAQSLLVREQLRHTLVLLCDESPDDFQRMIGDLLISADIRFHLKHLVLEVVSQIERPDQRLVDCLETLLGEDLIRPHILETVVWGRPQFVLALIDRGIINDWLASERPDALDSALWLLRSIIERSGDQIALILEPYMSKGDEWNKKVLWTLPLSTRDDSERVFELRLRLAVRGMSVTAHRSKCLCKMSSVAFAVRQEPHSPVYCGNIPNGGFASSRDSKPWFKILIRCQEWLPSMCASPPFALTRTTGPRLPCANIVIASVGTARIELALSCSQNTRAAAALHPVISQNGRT
jgi:hypothetical protein